MRRTLTLIALLALGLRGSAHAQADTTVLVTRIPAGSVVRVWTSDRAMAGQIAMVGPSRTDSLRLLFDDATISVPLVEVVRLDRRMPRSQGEGAGRGFARGLLAAVLFDMFLVAIGTGREGLDPTVGAIGVIMTPTFVIGGTLIGAAKPGVDWKTAYRR